ncbi:hypothetical protein VTJ83DRAFT_4317 [Remersonia thermophila]|uniref:Uncharacterized protein n=1 Tax=Remersonia thermophila TaxID=72144 RepID=A0ABR4D9K0_9PEZI
MEYMTIPLGQRRKTMQAANTPLTDPTTEPPSCSPAAGQDVEDLDMPDADEDTNSEDSALPDSPNHTSVGSRDGDNLALPAGVLPPPPNMPWRHRLVQAQRAGARVVAKDEYVDDMSDNWDSYGDIPAALEEYNAKAAGLEGMENWNADQRKLHKLIYMRGLHPILPSWWRVSFKMWGVTQPHLDDLFTPKNSRKGVAIHAYGNEVAAAKALESLFYLSQTVTDYEEIGYESKIAPTVVKTLRGYIQWALRDAGIDKHKSLLNMLVRSYPPEFMDAAPAPSGSDLSSPDDSSGDYDDQFAEDRRVQRFTRAVSRDVERRLRQLGQRWRDSLQQQEDARQARMLLSPGRRRPQAPTLYAFAVIQHIVLLASHDPNRGENGPVVVLEQVPLNDRSQWLWNALSLALPVNLARDALCQLWDTGNIVALQPGAKDDPDL